MKKLNLSESIMARQNQRLIQAFTLFVVVFIIYLTIHYFKNYANTSIADRLPSKKEEETFLNNYDIVKEDSNFKDEEFYNELNVSLKLPLYCQKFIILTTINTPTPNVKYVSDALYGWCLLVVGDKKTPKDWSYKNAFYLGIDDQYILAKKYKTVGLIPLNSYLRKMVAYLFAINNGATYIYETDDDNAPLDGLFGFRYERFKGVSYSIDSKCAETGTKFVNPYAYFGQPSVWPRGYPLEKISPEIYTPSNEDCLTNSNKKKLAFTIFEESQVPLIQQG